MAYQAISIKLDTRKLDQLRGGVASRAEVVLGKIAGDVEQGWKDFIVLKHVIDTSAYHNSIKVRPKTERFVRIISDGVPYGIYQEYGTSRFPARPCATPAVERVRPGLIKAWGELFK